MGQEIRLLSSSDYEKSYISKQESRNYYITKNGVNIFGIYALSSSGVTYDATTKTLTWDSWYGTTGSFDFKPLVSDINYLNLTYKVEGALYKNATDAQNGTQKVRLALYENNKESKIFYETKGFNLGLEDSPFVYNFSDTLKINQYLKLNCPIGNNNYKVVIYDVYVSDIASPIEMYLKSGLDEEIQKISKAMIIDTSGKPQQVFPKTASIKINLFTTIENEIAGKTFGSIVCDIYDENNQLIKQGFDLMGYALDNSPLQIQHGYVLKNFSTHIAQTEVPNDFEYKIECAPESDREIVVKGDFSLNFISGIVIKYYTVNFDVYSIVKSYVVSYGSVSLHNPATLTCRYNTTLSIDITSYKSTGAFDVFIDGVKEYVITSNQTIYVIPKRYASYLFTVKFPRIAFNAPDEVMSFIFKVDGYNDNFHAVYCFEEDNYVVASYLEANIIIRPWMLVKSIQGSGPSSDTIFDFDGNGKTLNKNLTLTISTSGTLSWS